MHRKISIQRALDILRLAFLCVILLVVANSAGLAVESQEPEQMSALMTSVSVPVIVDGKELFRVGGISSYPAKERARVVAERIVALAQDPAVDPQKLEIVRDGDITFIKAGSANVIGLVQGDAEREGAPLDVMAELIQAKIARSIMEYREDRTPRTLLIKSGYALLATVLTVLLLWGILRFFAWVDKLIQRKLMARIEKLESRTHYLFDADQIGEILGGLLKAAKVLIVLVVVYFYLNLVLGLYPWTRLFALYLFTLTVDPLRIIGRGILNALPNIFFLVIFFFITRYVLKITRLFFAGIDRGNIQLKSFDREWSMPTYRIVRLLIVSFALIIAYPYIPGSSSDAFKGVSIFLGVIFSLGSSSVLANIIAGYTITYRRAFKIGDRIMINDVVGDVTARSVLVTRLRSLKNEEIVIPNSTVLNSNVINYSTQARANGLILHTTVGIGYEVPWRQVEAILLQAADRTRGIRVEPKPFVLQKSLGDFAINYELNVYCEDAGKMQALYSELHRNILDMFNEYNVQIMTPNYVQDTQQPKIVPQDQWYAPPARKSTGDPGHG